MIFKIIKKLYYQKKFSNHNKKVYDFSNLKVTNNLIPVPDPTPVPNVPLPPVVIPTIEPTIQPVPTIIGIIPTAVQASEQEIEEKSEESSSAACNKPVGSNVSLFTGMGNIMTMIGPLVFFIAYRRVRKFWD